MMTVIAIVHIVACVFLIALVLLQDPKQSGAGAMFGGGGSNTVLGATGATTLMQRMTRYAAIVFGVCCLLLTLFARREAGSVFDSAPVATPISAPVSEPVSGAPTNPATAPLEAPAATLPKVPTESAPADKK